MTPAVIAYDRRVHMKMTATYLECVLEVDFFGFLQPQRYHRDQQLGAGLK